MGARLTLRLDPTCDNQCVFCAQAGLGEVAATLSLDERLATARAAADELTFIGGEPLLVATLPDAIARAIDLGFVRVGVQTNGRRLAARAVELSRAGLTDVHLSMHGARAAVHDYHSGVDGSFAALVDGAHAARALGLTLAVSTVLTRSSFRVLAELPPLLRGLGVAAWTIVVPRAAGRADDAFDRVMPRLGLALPFALHALASAERLGLAAFIQGAPLCRLGPFARLALPEPPRAFAAVCAGCPARARCSGVDARYLARFDGDELGPCTSPATDAPDDALAQLFVGIGPLAPPRDAPRPAARLRLPVAGRVEPAVGEVSTRAERKSGAELRALFPALFDADR